MNESVRIFAAHFAITKAKCTNNNSFARIASVGTNKKKTKVVVDKLIQQAKYERHQSKAKGENIFLNMLYTSIKYTDQSFKNTEA